MKRFRLRETDLEDAGDVPGHDRSADPDLKYNLERAIDGCQRNTASRPQLTEVRAMARFEELFLK